MCICQTVAAPRNELSLPCKCLVIEGRVDTSCPVSCSWLPADRRPFVRRPYCSLEIPAGLGNSSQNHGHCCIALCLEAYIGHQTAAWPFGMAAGGLRLELPHFGQELPSIHILLALYPFNPRRDLGLLALPVRRSSMICGPQLMATQHEPTSHCQCSLGRGRKLVGLCTSLHERKKESRKRWGMSCTDPAPVADLATR